MQPTIILIHGATLNGASWAPVRRRLESSWRVLAPDLPGHGSRRGEAFTLQGAVDTVVSAARSAGGAPLVLAGDSLGAYTAQAAAASLPREQLKGLVLGGASQEFRGPQLWPHQLKALMFRLIFALKDERRMVDAKMPGALRDLGLDEEDARATMDAGVSMTVFPQAVKELRGFDFKSALAAIEQPTLFVNGDQDSFHVRGEAAYVAAARDATVHRFADCDHGVSLRRAAGYADLVDGFTRRVCA
ncbi:Pimeloyl-[acyl-carrier protein] methyl ester esterase [Massilia sp. Bi118]|uniref:alpha/beta fold hydrolase n=1 Tax=Massilia sp. Bi118 TaxID=2822346 RepID=UPI001E1231B8|nr:alpha/beta hydrolase [Massilia sp. Bi118]CAH0268628.1 Pimeloyl-[acyl-carrier protein] methyl ester esterase [Massilia sp. Bi118]